MKDRCAQLIFGFVLLLAVPPAGFAAPDEYLGDSAIYAGADEGGEVRPNVMFFINNSRNMVDQKAGTGAYDSETIYSGPYVPNGVYFRNNPSSPWNLRIQAASDGSLKVSCGGDDPHGARQLLLHNGFFKGGLNSDGNCSNKNNDQKDFYLGNLVNKLESTPVINEWQSNTTYPAGQIIHPPGNTQLLFRSLNAGASGGSSPEWPTEPAGATVEDGTMTWEMLSSIFDVTREVVLQVVESLRNQVNVGVMVFGNNNDGGWVKAPVARIGTEEIDGSAGEENYQNLRQQIINLAHVSSNTHEPIAGALYDASLYFRGQYDSNARVGQPRSPAYPSPIEHWCEVSHVVVLTTGASAPTSPTANALGDLNGDGIVGPEDGAYLLYNTDHRPNTQEIQRVNTNVIQFLTKSLDLERATDKDHGNGTYVLANSTEDLEAALRDILSGIVAEVDTSFVAPVVPASTTNRTISGNRVYLGLFKPQNENHWLGNLKKYQVGADNRLKDKYGNDATYSIEEAEIQGDVSAGDFLPSSISYWSNDADGGDVLKGGAGSLLSLNTSRNIYTYLPQVTNQPKDLTHSHNAFATTNTLVSADVLELTDPDERNLLIDYVHGRDAFDDSGNGITNEMREHVMGDILHSRPLVFSYEPFAMTETNESNCGVNKSYIFVGSNGGALHAFRDCDGSEAWAFLPDNVLGDLQYLRNNLHTPFVDAPISAYVHDRNNDGVIDPLAGDRVLLVFGQRRGGGSNTLAADAAKGAYYILDVSDPETPKFVSKFDRSQYTEMGQAWSQPRLTRIKHGEDIKVVAFLGGGYDQNEDLRYGNTQNFPGDTTATTNITLADLGSGLKTRPATFQESGPRVNPSGRGVFAIEVARLVKGQDGKYDANIEGSGNLLWHLSYHASTNPNMTYSFPSDVAVLDVNGNGFADRLYVGDTGGRMWRFDVGSNNPNHWSGRMIFRSNAGQDGTNGRKIFYRPSVVFDKGMPILYFGTGDREHPLNRHVVDRLYALYDRGQTYADYISENHLVDVTTNVLQESSDTSLIDSTLDALKSSTNYGWYIKLNENSGEKVLAASTVFNNVAYFSTYSPNTNVAPDPCKPGNLGTSRVYQVDARTGEAIINNDKSNDGDSANERAAHEDGYVLKRSDRVQVIGEGIPSGIVTLIDASGRVTMMISSSNRVNTVDALDARMISPVYWMQW
ncbi:type IV pilus assembly protein PilY1 [Geoalkalibacter ferrihydriticus]|uniref:PilC beta-propeller domain-containing protein n=2 Tax=Geoalkalibacter ferrihydriticus TaxID=392333 RepID=A0A0C2DTZ0_9BACT|nr:hypothetical protein [Geoalkalibacter ferrihydriticus]KIH76919.1 hypothetical protein GFER_07470 [Geoalkalibacter ferrihydriticus DSM 17813]SDL44426.1 type IV pilus assembly protein PilY1 [Geoalkalibacter ferrihydriticus]